MRIRSRIVPAPLCNVSDRPFRDLVRAMGGDLVYTQMITAEGLVRNDSKTWRLLDTVGEAPPVCVQLVGAVPDSLAGAARLIEESGAVIVDLNLGCPAHKITGNECGSALMRDPGLVLRIVKAIRRAVRIPFTVKMRAGWGGGEFTAIELARMCEAEGVDAVALHARTREQGYRGHADWTLIARLKQAMGIPVIGNGDVTSPADAVRMLRETGCDAVMIGRGLMGNPWLMRACTRAAGDYLAGIIRDESEVPGDAWVLTDDGGTHVPVRVPYYMKEVTLDERLDLVLTHTRLMVSSKGERRGVLEMRKHSQNYTRGIRGCKLLRERLMKIEHYDDIERLIHEYRTWLGTGHSGPYGHGTATEPDPATA